MLLMISRVKKSLEHFKKKELQKTNQQEIRVEKVIKRKVDKLYAMIYVYLIAGLIKKT